jgi:hypothetical protein
MRLPRPPASLPAGERRGPGPRWEQTSNAYRPVVPKRLLSLLPRWLRPAPVPDDALQHVAGRPRSRNAQGATDLS